MMAKKQHVIICGSNVILTGIAVSLRLDPDCEVIGHALTIDRQELDALQPDVVIFELDALSPELLYILSKDNPGLLLIGIDPESNRAVLRFEQQAEGMSSQDLVQVIHQAKFIVPISGREK